MTAFVELFCNGTLFATAIWHAMAAYYFIFRTDYMVRCCCKRAIPLASTSLLLWQLKYATHARPVSEIAKDLFRFLGGINTGFVALALAGLLWSSKHSHLPTVYFALAVANFSQFAFDVVCHRSGRWVEPLLQNRVYKHVSIADSIAFHSCRWVDRNLAPITFGDAAFTLANLACCWITLSPAAAWRC